MAIRTILALLDGKSGSRAAIRFAAEIGRALSAEVSALHVRAEPLKSLPMMGDPMAALSVPEVLQVLTETTDRIAREAHDAFDAEISESPLNKKVDGRIGQWFSSSRYRSNNNFLAVFCINFKGDFRFVDICSISHNRR